MLALSSCSTKLGELSADNFKVTPNPLESKGGQVAVTIDGTFPEKYLKKKAVVTVVPELRYGDGQVAQGQAATFQGEKVEGNDQTISYKMGGSYTMKANYKYVPDMQKSDLYMTLLILSSVYAPRGRNLKSSSSSIRQTFARAS